MERSGHMLDQRYRLGRLLGQGGMACVYLGEDTRLGKAVAVKVLNHEYALQPKVVQRFSQEARAISRVRHANVVDVTDHGVTPDGTVYLVMELLDGEDLSATLEREGPLPWSRLGPIALQICAALATVHRAGIVHRDVKPSNCFRVRVAGNPDVIKVLDFGIAKVLEGPAAPGAPQSTTGSLLGTPEYMAPELPKGLRADARVDIYSLGVLLYKLLTGSAPFTGEGYMAVLTRHMFDPVEPPRERAPERAITPEVEAIVLRALAKERDDRWPSMVALADAIAASLPGQPSARAWLEGSRDAPAGAPAAPAAGEAPDPAPALVRELPVDLAHADTSPRHGPETLAQRRWPRVPLRTALLAGGAALAVFAALRLWLGPDAEPSDAGRTARTSGPAGVTPVERRSPAKLSPGTASADNQDLSPGTASADRPGLSPETASADRPGLSPETASAGPAALDVAACQAVLRPLAERLRGCASAGGPDDEEAGGFELQLQLGPYGRATLVEAAPGSRKIGGEALTCMRVLIAMQSFPSSQAGGSFRMRF
ncbi:serine/threonine-protein kinase [Nannocystis sp.]|uniref:serine/threonine-protein kinase n=1 Tax=Nannocystis sp. TaxID=1962667 RepID=UPI0025EF419C|nr:serine/threonine-protein kinase [Nannocystis sp.]MBK7826068.1 protein kinase [Nannocystis sp.]